MYVVLYLLGAGVGSNTDAQSSFCFSAFFKILIHLSEQVEKTMYSIRKQNNFIELR